MNHQLQNIERRTRELCTFKTGVVSDENKQLFEKMCEELPFELHRYPSGLESNGWTVPQAWRVKKAEVFKNGEKVFDGKDSALGVAYYSRSFSGKLPYEFFKNYVVTNSDVPEAHIFHCMWQYRPWHADWALSIPYDTFKNFGEGNYSIELETEYSEGEMVVAEYHLQGELDKTIIFNAHTCHPHMANDGFAGVAVLMEIAQWLRSLPSRRYSYKFLFGPEHLGTVFFLKDKTCEELYNYISGVFAEMPGTSGAIKVTSTFLGGQPIDRAFQHVLKHYSKKSEVVGWRKGAGNDETVWEAPGYEVPFVEMTRCIDQFAPFREYHTDLDTPGSLDWEQVGEFFTALQNMIFVLENNCTMHRKFSGLICLSNPKYDLYMERPDPAVHKDLPEDSEKWGHLLDSLLRYFDGEITILDIAEKHDLPFKRLFHYLKKYEEKGLIILKPVIIERVPISEIHKDVFA
ncbi:MAG TPA: DUF4910 domain-containing protein [Patescibacteria group bacterium]|nr:DUF4910 domain-containing protein [Patescibacteria group bacterium]